MPLVFHATCFVFFVVFLILSMLLAKRSGESAALPCETCLERVRHSASLFSKAPGLRATADGGFPRVARDSPLNWCPTVDNVCVFPIREGRVCGEGEFGEWGQNGWVHRPIFYSELNSASYLVLKRRWKRVRWKRVRNNLKF